MSRPKNRTKYTEKWEKLISWLKRCEDVYSAYCTICEKRFRVDNGGYCQVKCHARGQRHIEREIIRNMPPKPGEALEKLKGFLQHAETFNKKLKPRPVILKPEFQRVADEEVPPIIPKQAMRALQRAESSRGARKVRKAAITDLVSDNDSDSDFSLPSQVFDSSDDDCLQDTLDGDDDYEEMAAVSHGDAESRDISQNGANYATSVNGNDMDTNAIGSEVKVKKEDLSQEQTSTEESEREMKVEVLSDNVVEEGDSCLPEGTTGDSDTDDDLTLAQFRDSTSAGDGYEAENFDDGYINPFDIFDEPPRTSTKNFTQNCCYCGQYCETREALEEHQGAHLQVPTFPCLRCPMSFISEECRSSHETVVHSGVGDYECSQCYRRFEEKADRDTHYFAQHKQPTLLSWKPQEPHACLECGREFVKRLVLQEHQIVEHGAAIGSACLGCNRYFPRKNLLVQHMRSHTGENPYTCDECGRKFSRVSSLQRHKLSHDGMKPYQCEQCGLGYSQKIGLLQHKRSKHADEFAPNEIPTHCCEICGKVFLRRDYLNQHLVVHTKERNFHCLFCNKAFRDRNSLSRHVTRHGGDKPHKCLECHKTFARACELSRHSVSHRRRAERVSPPPHPRHTSHHSTPHHAAVATQQLLQVQLPGGYLHSMQELIDRGGMASGMSGMAGGMSGMGSGMSGMASGMSGMASGSMGSGASGADTHTAVLHYPTAAAAIMSGLVDPGPPPPPAHVGAATGATPHWMAQLN